MLSRLYGPKLMRNVSSTLLNPCYKKLRCTGKGTPTHYYQGVCNNVSLSVFYVQNPLAKDN